MPLSLAVILCQSEEAQPFQLVLRYKYLFCELVHIKYFE